MATTDVTSVLQEAGAPAVSTDILCEWMLRQRWFASKSRAIAGISVLDAVTVAGDGEPLILLIVEVRSPAGTHDLYQLPVGVSHGPRAVCDADILHSGDAVIYDALADERQMSRLGEMLAREASLSHGSTAVVFHRAGEMGLASHPTARRVASEQSNSSVVFDDAFILKAFRRLEPGINPELEMLNFLAAHGFANLAPVVGWYSYQGDLLDCTLGVMQSYVRGASDGWQAVLSALADGRGEDLVGPLGELGAVTGRMHAALASDAEDPVFAPEEPSDEQVALMAATIDEQIERLFVDLPAREELEPIQGRGQELRDRLAMLSHIGVGGRLIRSHGDFHLGQTLIGPSGWTVLDFEGEPGRPLRERRLKRSPLRDVAGMLRSFAYAELAGELLHGGTRPTREWERRVRESFLDGYMATTDASLLPAGAQALEKQLAMFELEKVLYELRYELENRPDWLVVPVSAVLRLLEADTE